jgi:hypothetical protein
MIKSYYQFIYLGEGIPTVLTVMREGMPTIALAGKESGCRSTISGEAKQIRLSVKDGLWGLVVTTENDIEISVIGKQPIFSDPT